MTYSNKTLSTSKKPWAIKLTDISIRFEDYTALKDISLSFARGSFTYIVGPNGSGKTTLLNLLLGLLKPDAGSIEIESKGIGYLPQKLHQRRDVPLSVEELVYSGFDKQNLRISAADRELIDKWLDKMEMSGMRLRLLKSLSGGQAQRVFLCRALINDPDIIILDEPTSALDPEFRKAFNDLIDSLHESGKTVIYVTHDLHDIQRADKRVVYVDQSIRFVGHLEEYALYEKGEHHV